jgi:hypothetical protein
MHRSEVICLPQAGVALRCFHDLESMPHWTARMGHAPTVQQIANAWSWHLEQETDARDG